LRTDQALRDQISNWSLLTSEERSRFHQEMQQASTDAERTRIRTEHRNIIAERARELGVDAPFGPGTGAGPAQNRYLMSLLLTDQERSQFHERMRMAGSDAERDRIRNEHRDMVHSRAREMGIDLPDGF
jgi:ferritin-like protein